MATSRLCSIPDCGKPIVNERGWCSAHYERWKRHGDPLGGRVPNGEALQFLETVVFPFRGEACFPWPYTMDGKGYGRVRRNGRMEAAHRLACEHLNGPAPTEKHEAAHNCGNRRCVNPLHIRWATCVENNADKISHDTHNRGHRNGMAKLTEAQVRTIKRMLAKGDLLQFEIAELMGVCKQNISDIHRGRRWGWVDAD